MSNQSGVQLQPAQLSEPVFISRSKRKETPAATQGFLRELSTVLATNQRTAYVKDTTAIADYATGCAETRHDGVAR